MTKDQAFKVLGIAPSSDEKIIQKTYDRLIGQYRPEDFPKEWQQIRDAYETAVKWSEKNKDSLQLSLDVLNSLKKKEKQCLEDWKQLFEKPELEPALRQEKFIYQWGKTLIGKEIDKELYAYLEQQLKADENYFKQRQVPAQEMEGWNPVEYADMKIKTAYRRFQSSNWQTDGDEQQGEEIKEPKDREPERKREQEKFSGKEDHEPEKIPLKKEAEQEPGKNSWSERKGQEPGKNSWSERKGQKPGKNFRKEEKRPDVKKQAVPTEFAGGRKRYAYGRGGNPVSPGYRKGAFSLIAVAVAAVFAGSFLTGKKNEPPARPVLDVYEGQELAGKLWEIQEQTGSGGMEGGNSGAEEIFYTDVDPAQELILRSALTMDQALVQKKLDGGILLAAGICLTDDFPSVQTETNDLTYVWKEAEITPEMQTAAGEGAAVFAFYITASGEEMERKEKVTRLLWCDEKELGLNEAAAFYYFNGAGYVEIPPYHNSTETLPTERNRYKMLGCQVFATDIYEIGGKEYPVMIAVPQPDEQEVLTE